jgi:hypothetical protein
MVSNKIIITDYYVPQISNMILYGGYNNCFALYTIICTQQASLNNITMATVILAHKAQYPVTANDHHTWVTVITNTFKNIIT